MKYGEILQKDAILNHIGKTIPGAYSYAKYMRWYDDLILNNYDEARLFLKENDRGNFDNLAVRYMELPEGVTSVELESLRLQFEQAVKEQGNLERTDYIQSLKAEYIGCKGCGSKVSKKYIKFNKCPVCGYDLRSDSVKRKIAEAKNKVKEIQEQIKQEEQKLMGQDVNIKWLIKIEYLKY